MTPDLTVPNAPAPKPQPLWGKKALYDGLLTHHRVHCDVAIMSLLQRLKKSVFGAVGGSPRPRSLAGPAHARLRAPGGGCGRRDRDGGCERELSTPWCCTRSASFPKATGGPVLPQPRDQASCHVPLSLPQLHLKSTAFPSAVMTLSILLTKAFSTS